MTSSSSGGMSNMSRLLSSSRLSSFHPKVPQVYTAPASHISRGDFGLKRPLPTSHLFPGQIRYVDIDNVDTKEGQTTWKEREREVLLLKRLQEMNLRIEEPSEDNTSVLLRSGESKTRSSKWTLGPRISTRFDPSTTRPLPADFNDITIKEYRKFLQGEARIGRAQLPSRVPNEYQQDDPFGRVSYHYTESPATRLNFRTMNQKRFEKYLENIREKRESFKDYKASIKAMMARNHAATEYYDERKRMEKEGEDAKKLAPEGEAIDVQLPPKVQEQKLPILKRGLEDEKSVNIDLWSEARYGGYLQRQYESWLQSEDLHTVREEKSKHLPLKENRIGGYEIHKLMHTNGGMQYSQIDTIATNYLQNTLPARKLGKAVIADKRLKSAAQSQVAVAIGGLIGAMPSQYSYSSQSSYIDTSGNEPQRGSIRVRAISATIEVKPEFSDLFGVKDNDQEDNESLPFHYGKISVNLKQDNSETSNRNIPGSRDWVGLKSGKATNFVDLGDLDALTSGIDSRPYIDTKDYPPGLSRVEQSRRIKRDLKRISPESSKRSLDRFTKRVLPEFVEKKNAQAAQTSDESLE